MGDVSGVGWAKLLLGDISYHLDDLSLAEHYFRDALVIFRLVNRLGNMAYLLEALGSLAFARADYQSALALVDESLLCYETIGRWSTFSRAYRAAIAQKMGDMQTAQQWLLRCVSPLSDIEMEYRATYLLRLGDFVLAREDHSSAALIYSAALRFHADPVSGLFPTELRDAQIGLDAAQRSLPEAEFSAAKARGEMMSFESVIRTIFPSAV
jgi:tetratricopeptide (TPR) repeat protein